MNELIVVGVVKKADMKYTPAGKAVLNVTINDFRKDKNEKWHGASFKATFWEEAAETAVKYIKEGESFIFTGAVDGVETYERADGTIGTSIVFQFPKWAFVPTKRESLGTAVAEDGSTLSFED